MSLIFKYLFLQSYFLNCVLWLLFPDHFGGKSIFCAPTNPPHFSIICHINVSIVTVFVPNVVPFIFNICFSQNILPTIAVLIHAVSAEPSRHSKTLYVLILYHWEFSGCQQSIQALFQSHATNDTLNNF